MKCAADFYAFAADQNQNPDPDSRFETQDESSQFSGQLTAAFHSKDAAGPKKKLHTLVHV